MTRNKAIKQVMDVFTKVEADAKRLLKDPTTKGAAKAVLNYIKGQREGNKK